MNIIHSFLLFLLEHRTSVKYSHPSMMTANVFTSFQVSPTVRASSCTVLYYIFLGHPLFLAPADSSQGLLFLLCLLTFSRLVQTIPIPSLHLFLKWILICNIPLSALTPNLGIVHECKTLVAVIIIQVLAGTILGHLLSTICMKMLIFLVYSCPI